MKVLHVYWPLGHVENNQKGMTPRQAEDRTVLFKGIPQQTRQSIQYVFGSGNHFNTNWSSMHLADFTIQDESPTVLMCDAFRNMFIGTSRGDTLKRGDELKDTILIRRSGKTSLVIQNDRLDHKGKWHKCTTVATTCHSDGCRGASIDIPNCGSCEFVSARGCNWISPLERFSDKCALTSSDQKHGGGQEAP